MSNSPLYLKKIGHVEITGFQKDSFKYKERKKEAEYIARLAGR